MGLIEKKITYYLRGRGLETSRTPILKGYKEAKVNLIFKEPNSLYHFYPEDGAGYESFDFVFNDGLLTETKFYKILMKEWFYLIKIGGNLIVRFTENDLVNGNKINKIFSDLAGELGEVLYVTKDESNNAFTVVVQKLSSVLQDNDSIDKWSFCIINSRSLDINSLVSSIKSQNIPHYEILVDNACGAVANKDLRIVEYGEGAHLTSVKKNKMLLNARHENVVIIDRSKADLILSERWYESTLRYGNYFEAISPVLVTRGGERCADWWTLGCNKDNITDNIFQTSKLGVLEYRDWEDWVYFPDPVCILKKSLYHKSLWDSYSAEGDENTLFSHRLYLKGVLFRMNPDLLFWVAEAKSGFLARNFPHFEYNPLRLGKRRGKFFRRSFWLIVEMLLKLSWVKKYLSPVIASFKDRHLSRIPD